MIHHTVTNGVRLTRALYRQLVASDSSFIHNSVYNYLRPREFFYVFLSAKPDRIKKEVHLELIGTSKKLQIECRVLVEF
jgi:hypothetical protein